MKILRRSLVTLLLLLLAAVTYLWLDPPALLRVGANYAAKIVCSNVFLAGREADEVLRSDVQAPGVWLLKLYRVSVDRERGVVRAGMFGFIGAGLAVARPGQGCTALPDAQLKAALAQVSSSPPPAAPARDAPWPQGERLEADATYQHLVDDPALGGAGLRALVVIDHGHLVAERYGAGFNATTPLLGWSMTKTVTAALVGLLVKDGKLSLGQAALWPPGDGREVIRLADLLAMSSGLKFNEDYGVVSDVTRMLYLQTDMAGFAYAQPLEHPPGTVWKYSSGTANIVARIVQAAAGSSTFAHERLFAPLGMGSAVIEADERGTPVGSSYMYATAHDWARFGQLLAQNGRWDGQALLPDDFVDTMAQPAASSPGGEYGQGFVWRWASDAVVPGVNPDTAFGIPPDTFYLSGHDGQTVAVIRSRQLVVVRLGLTPVTVGYSPQPLLAALLKAHPAP